MQFPRNSLYTLVSMASPQRHSLSTKSRTELYCWTQEEKIQGRRKEERKVTCEGTYLNAHLRHKFLR